MRFTKTLAFVLPVVLLASCNKKPTANFSPSNETPLIQEEVSFGNSSTEADQYEWDFGDGTNSIEQSPKHAYAVEGTYTVTLKAYSSDKRKWATKQATVVVQHPQALFTAHINGTERKLYDKVNGFQYGYGFTGGLSSGTWTKVFYGTLGSYSGPSTLEEIRFEVGTATYPDTWTLADSHPLFHSMIRVQEWYFSTGAASGIRIQYTAPSGVIWASDAGTADQTGSDFKITYTKDMTDAGFEAEFFKAHFNCKLYNGLGGVMTLDDATLELIMANKP